MLQVKLVRSPIGCSPRQQKTLKALGLRKLNQVKSVEESPAIRGMVEQVKHLVEVTQA